MSLAAPEPERVKMSTGAQKDKLKHETGSDEEKKEKKVNENPLFHFTLA